MLLAYHLDTANEKLVFQEILGKIMSTTKKCCHCDKCFFDVGGLSCPHCHFPILREKKSLSFDLWDKIKAIFNKE